MNVDGISSPYVPKTVTHGLEPSHVRLDSWVVMPDHMHGIIVIGTPNRTVVEADQWSVSTRIANTVSLSIRRPDSLGSIIAQFKPACTKNIRAMGYTDFAWQTRYYERILWNERDVNIVRKYIRMNPNKWKM